MSYFPQKPLSATSLNKTLQGHTLHHNIMSTDLYLINIHEHFISGIAPFFMNVFKYVKITENAPNTRLKNLLYAISSFNLSPNSGGI